MTTLTLAPVRSTLSRLQLNIGHLCQPPPTVPRGRPSHASQQQLHWLQLQDTYFTEHADSATSPGHPEGLPAPMASATSSRPKPHHPTTVLPQPPPLPVAERHEAVRKGSACPTKSSQVKSNGRVPMAAGSGGSGKPRSSAAGGMRHDDQNFEAFMRLAERSAASRRGSAKGERNRTWHDDDD